MQGNMQKEIDTEKGTYISRSSRKEFDIKYQLVTNHFKDLT